MRIISLLCVPIHVIVYAACKRIRNMYYYIHYSIVYSWHFSCMGSHTLPSLCNVQFWVPITGTYLPCATTYYTDTTTYLACLPFNPEQGDNNLLPLQLLLYNKLFCNFGQKTETRIYFFPLSVVVHADIYLHIGTSMCSHSHTYMHTRL